MLGAKVAKTTTLCDEENHRVLMIRLEIDNSEIEIPAKYTPGDHAAVFPSHTDSEVHFVMEHLTKKPSDPSKAHALYEYNQNEGMFMFLVQCNIQI